MKKLVLVAVVFVFLFAVVGKAMAAKPAGNLAGAQKAGAQKAAWNLSGAVMPVPLYGSEDITGSDKASKLIVNQPKGKTKVTITGVMNGLDPKTAYTVFLSNGYTPYVSTDVYTGWNVTGNWKLAFYSTNYPSGNPYMHDMIVTDGTATGGTPARGTYVNSWTAIVSVSGDSVKIVATYKPGSKVHPYTFTATGTIASVGTISGTWSDTLSDSGTWISTSGSAVKTYTGGWWPGLFTSTVQPFTFTTNAHGSGSWHINLKDSDFPGLGIYTHHKHSRSFTDTLSVWINQGLPYQGPTLLISDTFRVTVSN